MRMYSAHPFFVTCLRHGSKSVGERKRWVKERGKCGLSVICETVYPPTQTAETAYKVFQDNGADYLWLIQLLFG